MGDAVVVNKKQERAPATGPASEARQLNERDLAILKDVVWTHILSAEPVSSRAVSKHSHHGLSAATIRNVMADLEEDGFLYQPHSSSGRVPTPRAYHLFIDTLMRAQSLPEKERRYIRESLREARGSSDQVMEVASQLLSELSHRVGVVLTPALAETRLKSMEFVPLTGHKVLCVVVSVSGFVDNKVIESREPLPREELLRVSNYVTENFAGMTLEAIRERLLKLMAQDRAQLDRMLALAMEMAEKGLDRPHQQAVLLEGTNEVLSLPELADVQRVRRLLETFNDKARLVYMLTECIRGHGVRVVIGEDNDLTSELDFSLVATSYSVENRPLGTLGVFGPTRMEYPRLIPLVDYLGTMVSRALSESFAEHQP